MKVTYVKYIPLHALVELKLKPSQILLCTILVSFAKEGKTLRVGYPKLGKAYGVSGSTCERDIAKLAVLGLINIVSGKAQRNANEYTPTKKLLGLYSQNGHINIAKMANHTPSKEGYNRETDADALARRHGFTKEYAADQKLFGIENAKARLEQRIAMKQG